MGSAVPNAICNPATKTSRELHLGNTPPGIPEIQLKTLLNEALTQAGLVTPDLPGGNAPIVQVRVSAKFAFAEFRTVEEATMVSTPHHRTGQHCVAQHEQHDTAHTAQCNTAQRGAAQHSATQPSIVWHSMHNMTRHAQTTVEQHSTARPYHLRLTIGAVAACDCVDVRVLYMTVATVRRG